MTGGNQSPPDCFVQTIITYKETKLRNWRELPCRKNAVRRTFKCSKVNSKTLAKKFIKQLDLLRFAIHKNVFNLWSYEKCTKLFVSFGAWKKKIKISAKSLLEKQVAVTHHVKVDTLYVGIFQLTFTLGHRVYDGWRWKVLLTLNSEFLE